MSVQAARAYRPVLLASVLLLTAGAFTPGTSASATSHDSARIAVATGRIVAAADGPDYVVSMLPDGSDRQRVVKFLDGAFVGPIDASQDGSKIAMTFGPKKNGHIYTVNSDGSDFKQVSRGGDDYTPTFSPTGARIVFGRNSDGDDTLIRAKVDGTDATLLTAGAEPKAFAPSWSPDGKSIAFIEFSRDTQTMVVTDRSGTWFRFLRTIPRDRGDVLSLNWSADSSKIIYSKFNSDFRSSDLWTIDADGSNLSRITDTPHLFETGPAYSPDGSAIACSVISYSQQRGGQSDVLVMSADGSNRQRIDTPKADEAYVAWGG